VLAIFSSSRVKCASWAFNHLSQVVSQILARIFESCFLFVISDRTILLNKGKMEQEGTPSELYAKPASPFVAEFIGRTNVLKASLVQDMPEKKMAKLSVTDFGTEMISQYEGELPKGVAFVTIRYNEIGMSSQKPDTDENVVRGEILSREYKGFGYRSHDTSWQFTDNRDYSQVLQFFRVAQ
jgi:ABC-type Fe3+/spermidine/putrescine transport system ATPase subunit